MPSNMHTPRQNSRTWLLLAPQDNFLRSPHVGPKGFDFPDVARLSPRHSLPRRVKRHMAFILLFIVTFSLLLFLRKDAIYAGSSRILKRASRRSMSAQSIEYIEDAEKRRKVLAGATATGLAQIRMTPDQELAAVTSHLSGLEFNTIPTWVDPMVPIDPQLVLDFDTTRANAATEVVKMVEDTWASYPVFVYSKFYSPVSRELKQILLNMNITPAPTIIDVDTRDDVGVLAPLIARLVQSPDLPSLLVGGVAVGSIIDIRALHASGELRKMIEKAGGSVAPLSEGKQSKRKRS